MIDNDGFRLNVGIILVNTNDQLLWARRCGQNAWQFPQGGIKESESVEEALYRELHEEVGLTTADVEMLGCTQNWLHYYLPKRFIRYYSKPLCIGQKQKWFMLRLLANDNQVNLQQCEMPEFDHWKWVTYWHPLKEVVSFKRHVYRQALREFAPLVFPERSLSSRLEALEV